MYTKRAYPISVFVLIALLVGCSLHRPQTRQVSHIRMPDEITDIRLAVTMKELVERRENIKPFRLGFEDDLAATIYFSSEKEMLFEAIEGSLFFRYALYVIQKGVLTDVTLSGDIGPSRIRAVRQDLILSCIQRWGESHKRTVYRSTTGKKFKWAVIEWRDGPYLMMVLFRVEQEGLEKYTITLMIADTSLHDEDMVEAGMGQKEVDALFKSAGLDDVSLKKAGILRRK